MHTEQKVWSNWSLRQQNYLNCLVGGPVRPNMLNMPKSASAYDLEMTLNLTSPLDVSGLRYNGVHCGTVPR